MVSTRKFRGGKKSKRHTHHKHHSTHRRKVKRYSRRGTKKRRRKRTKRLKRGGGNKTRKIMVGGGMTYFLGLTRSKPDGLIIQDASESIPVVPEKDSSWGRANSASVENVKKALNNLRGLKGRVTEVTETDAAAEAQVTNARSYIVKIGNTTYPILRWKNEKEKKHAVQQLGEQIREFFANNPTLEHADTRAKAAAAAAEAQRAPVDSRLVASAAYNSLINTENYSPKEAIEALREKTGLTLTEEEIAEFNKMVTDYSDKDRRGIDMGAVNAEATELVSEILGSRAQKPEMAARNAEIAAAAAERDRAVAAAAEVEWMRRDAGDSYNLHEQAADEPEQQSLRVRSSLATGESAAAAAATAAHEKQKPPQLPLLSDTDEDSDKGKESESDSEDDD